MGADRLLVDGELASARVLVVKRSDTDGQDRDNWAGKVGCIAPCFCRAGRGSRLMPKTSTSAKPTNCGTPPRQWGGRARALNS